MTTVSATPDQMKRVMSETMAAVSDYWERMAERRHYTDAQREAWRRTFEPVVGPGPLRVLDVGCGPGLFAQVWAEMGHHVTGLDYAPAMLERARARHARLGLPSQFVEGDGETPPFGDETFDVVTNRAVIHMLLSPGAAIHRWYRLLKPGGKLVTVNFTPPAWTIKGVLKSIGRYLYRGSRKKGVKLSRDDMRIMMETYKTLPFPRTPPKQLFELYTAAGFQGVQFVSDELVLAAQKTDEWAKVRKGGKYRHVLIGTRPGG